MSTRVVLAIFIVSLNTGVCVPLASKLTKNSLGSGLADSDKQVSDLSSENGNVGTQLRLQHGATASEDGTHTTLSNNEQVAPPHDPDSLPSPRSDPPQRAAHQPETAFAPGR